MLCDIAETRFQLLPFNERGQYLSWCPSYQVLYEIACLSFTAWRTARSSRIPQNQRSDLRFSSACHPSRKLVQWNYPEADWRTVEARFLQDSVPAPPCPYGNAIYKHVFASGFGKAHAQVVSGRFGPHPIISGSMQYASAPARLCHNVPTASHLTRIRRARARSQPSGFA